MAFSHHHYAVIAAILADMREAPSSMGYTKGQRAKVLDELEDRLVRTFKNDNSRFSPDRFRRAAIRADNMHGKDKV